MAHHRTNGQLISSSCGCLVFFHAPSEVQEINVCADERERQERLVNTRGEYRDYLYIDSQRHLGLTDSEIYTEYLSDYGYVGDHVTQYLELTPEEIGRIERTFGA